MMKPSSVKKIPGRTSTRTNSVNIGTNSKNAIIKPSLNQKTVASSSVSKNQTKNGPSSAVTAKRTSATLLPAKKKTQPSSIFMGERIPKPTLPSKVVAQKYGYKDPANKKNTSKCQRPEGYGWGFVSYDIFLTICQYHSNSAYQIYSLSTVCRGWRFYLQFDEAKYCWAHIKQCQSIENFYQLKQLLQQHLIKVRQKMAVQYEKSFTKLFNYGSTKQNIPNKLIQKLNLDITVKLNSKLTLKKVPFKLRTFNFSSYLCFKVTQIQNWKYDFYTPHNMFKDKLKIQIKFHSNRYKVDHQVKHQFEPEDVVECSVRQKAFNYYLDKNLILTFFQGDDCFLYFFYEISALELVNIFRDSIALSQKQIIQSAMKKVPMYKKLATTQFQSFVEYLKYQADFQLHMSYHNSVKQIFTHCDTKVYPVQYDQKRAIFKVQINNTFDKVDTYKLDNKSGISEGIQNLYLLDLTLKDRDKFLLNFSGFIFARKAQQKERESIEDFFSFAENQMKILEFDSKRYKFKILIIEQFKKNLIKHIELIYYAP